MSPTWSALTLLLGSVVLLLAMLKSGVYRVQAALKASDVAAYVQVVALVNAMGCLTALSCAVLVAMLTVLADAVSMWWCTLHGATILGLSLLTAGFMNVLAFVNWAVCQQEEAQAQQAAAVVQRLTPGMAVVSMLFSLVVCVFGTFEQQTLFCFPYHPRPLMVLVFKLPMLVACLASICLSLHVAVKLWFLRLHTRSYEAYTPSWWRWGKPTVAEIVSRESPKTSSSTSEEDDVCSPEARDRSTAVRLERYRALVQPHTYSIKVTVSVLIIACAGFLCMMSRVLHPESSLRYFKGQDEDVASEVVHESQIGGAVFFLSSCGIVLFLHLGLDPTWWEVRRKNNVVR
mmetsp:Transcript_12874/g.23868  ORF Transcript_12874/g.23868 Transcript_12874/m.23868 type:complete len:345 (-) Transcript_12874:562-1596(-)